MILFCPDDVAVVVTLSLSHMGVVLCRLEECFGLTAKNKSILSFLSGHRPWGHEDQVDNVNTAPGQPFAKMSQTSRRSYPIAHRV
jgi:hypothetical protein